MDRGRSGERVRQEIVRLSHVGMDSRTFGIEAVRRLRKAIPTDVSFFATADPATLLFTSAVRDEVLAQATPQFLEREFLKDDPVKFARLARGRSPVESLGMATKGELVRSARYREMLAPMDLGDELRAALERRARSRTGRGWSCSRTISRSWRSRRQRKHGLPRCRKALGQARSSCPTQSMRSPPACSRSSVVVARRPTLCPG